MRCLRPSLWFGRMISLFAWSLLLTSQSMSDDTAAAWRVGAAKTDITPEEPVRLSGYAARGGPSIGISDLLSVRALVMIPIVDSDESSPLVIVSIDAIGISAVMTETILSQVGPRFGIPRSRIVLCTTHSHTAPHLEGVIPNLFAVPLAGDEEAASIRYRERVELQVINAIQKAMFHLQPGSVDIGLGRAEFAINRRMIQNQQWVGFGTVDDGPVDRSVRVLRVKNATGDVLAVAYQYACHCTSISSELNRISSDWAGLSATQIESAYPGCIALPIIGCGADANPNPRGTLENAQAHGDEMALAVRSVLDRPMDPLPHPTKTAFTLVALASERPSKSQIDAMAASGSAHERNLANHWLELLTRKDRLPESYPAPVHLWTFGDALAWVFMSGEVVVDYQMRLERELSQFQNVWVAAYVDDVFAYVASERLRGEGGYEVDGSMLYYGQPGRWVAGTEDAIVDRILGMQRQTHPADQPRSPEESLSCIEVPDGWTVELVASEPLVTDPINIAFGPDGKVWVVEMGDYPLGGPKTGCVKILRDLDRDGRMDTSAIFLDGLDYPAGVYPWRDGAVIACAPDVFFARDRDGDDVADERVTLLTGFPEGNPQHRVYGFTYGMEHRLFFGTGGSADQITVTGNRWRPPAPSSSETGSSSEPGAIPSGTPESARVAGHDLSLDPDTGKLFLETGDTQYIRASDDFGNWFGNENSIPMFHFVVDQRWLAQGGVAPRNRRQLMMDPPTVPPVFPISQQADRFNDLYTVNRFTSACSTVLNRSPGQGEGMRDFALVCEPVHNLVARFRLEPRGATWAAVRTPEDEKSDWLRSSDAWFRPVRIENAPDGTLWIVDMYRYVIEHPEWIPDEWQRRIDLRAGDDRGRIYRVRRSDFSPIAVTDFTSKEDPELIAELLGDSVARADQAQQVLVARSQDRRLVSTTVEALRTAARQHPKPAARVRGLASLIAMGAATELDFVERFRDSDPRVAESALRWIDRSPRPESLQQLVLESIPEAHLRSSASLALTAAIVTSSAVPHPAEAIARALTWHSEDPWVVECSDLLAPTCIDAVVGALLASESSEKPWIGTERILGKLIPRASVEARRGWMRDIAEAPSPRPAWHFSLARQLNRESESSLSAETLTRLLEDARRDVSADDSPIDVRIACLHLLDSQMGPNWGPDHRQLLTLLSQPSHPVLDREIARSLARLGNEVIGAMMPAWSAWSDAGRAAFLEEVVSQPKGVLELLTGVQQGLIPIVELDASTLQRLRQLADAFAAKRVLEILGPPPGEDRVRIVQEAMGRWPERVDIAAGKLAYEKHCAVCHEPRPNAEGIDAALAPDLRALAPWTNEAWVTAILDPNRSVEEKFWAFQARTRDGESLTGLVLREDPTHIEWVSTAGRIERIEKSEIAEIRSTRRSLMPEGFEQLVTPEQLAGLITYLRSASQDR